MAVAIILTIGGEMRMRGSSVVKLVMSVLSSPTRPTGSTRGASRKVKRVPVDPLGRVKDAVEADELLRKPR